jgi:hypothetical protein
MLESNELTDADIAQYITCQLSHKSVHTQMEDDRQTLQLDGKLHWQSAVGLGPREFDSVSVKAISL